MRTPQDYEMAFKRMTPEQQDQIRAQVAAGVASFQQWATMVAPLFFSIMQQAVKAAQPLIDAARELERQANEPPA